NGSMLDRVTPIDVCSVARGPTYLTSKRNASCTRFACRSTSIGPAISRRSNRGGITTKTGMRPVTPGADSSRLFLGSDSEIPLAEASVFAPDLAKRFIEFTCSARFALPSTAAPATKPYALKSAYRLRYAASKRFLYCGNPRETSIQNQFRSRLDLFRAPLSAASVGHRQCQRRLARIVDIVS